MPSADPWRDWNPSNANEHDYVPASAHPAISEIAEIWERIRPAPDLLPGRQHFQPTLVPGILPDITLVEVVRTPAIRLRYRLQGTRLVDLVGASLTGRWLDEVNEGFVGSSAEQSFERCINGRTPNWRRGRPQLTPLAKYAEIERVLLPLAQNGVVVDMVLVVSIFYSRAGFPLYRV